jgi:hypothetical protein
MAEKQASKATAPIEVTFEDGERKTMDLVLREQAGRQESLSERLDGGVEFVEVVDRTTGAERIVRRSAIVEARVPLAFEPAGEDRYPRRQTVRLTVDGGATIAGTLVWSGAARTVCEALNAPGLFARIVDSDAVVLVSKRHVLFVEPSGQPNL